MRDLFLIFSLYPIISVSSRIEIDFRTASTKPLPRFWTGTGFSPDSYRADPYDTSFILGPDSLRNTAMIGSIPSSKTKYQVRIHWMLNLIKAESHDKWDFSQLDRLIHRLWSHNLKPGFELMGNPGGFFADFEDRRQLKLWTKMIAEMIDHFVQRWGKSG